MSCARRDPELLFLLHGEAGAWTRWRTRRHLRRCGACRARLEELQRASALLADDIRRDSRLPSWRRAAALSWSPPVFSRPSPALLLAAAAAASALGLLTYQVHRFVFPRRSARVVSGCVSCHRDGVKTPLRPPSMPLRSFHQGVPAFERRYEK